MIRRHLSAMFIAFFVLVATSLAAVPASAQVPPPPARRAPMAALLRSPFRPVALQLAGLRLTPAQRQQVLGIFKAHRTDMRALNEKFRAARTRWQQSGQINIEERKALIAQRADILQAVRSEVLPVLTPEQQQRLAARRGRGRL